MTNKNFLPFLLPLRSLAFLAVFAVGAAATKRRLDDICAWWSLVATAVNFATIALLAFCAKKRGLTFLGLINYKRGRTSFWEAAAVCAVMLFVGMAGMIAAGFLCYGVVPYMAPMMVGPIPKIFAAANLLLLPVTTAIAEEGLYLGCGVNQIQGGRAAVLVPAFFFSLQHCFIPTLPEPRYIAYRFLSFLPLTLLLCLFYRKRRNPLPIMTGHALIDLATAVQIFAVSFS